MIDEEKLLTALQVMKIAGTDMTFDNLKIIIDGQPKVGEWIPCCEDSLPDEEVLCCDRYGEQMIGMVFEDEASDSGFSAESNECYMYDCVAWMSLPERYKI